MISALCYWMSSPLAEVKTQISKTIVEKRSLALQEDKTEHVFYIMLSPSVGSRNVTLLQPEQTADMSWLVVEHLLIFHLLPHWNWKRLTSSLQLVTPSTLKSVVVSNPAALPGSSVDLCLQDFPVINNAFCFIPTFLQLLVEIFKISGRILHGNTTNDKSHLVLTACSRSLTSSLLCLCLFQGGGFGEPTDWQPHGFEQPLHFSRSWEQLLILNQTMGEKQKANKCSTGFGRFGPFVFFLFFFKGNYFWEILLTN